MIKSKYIQTIKLKDKLILIQLLTYDYKILEKSDIYNWLTENLNDLNEDTIYELKKNHFIIDSINDDINLFKKAQNYFSYPNIFQNYTIAIYLTDKCNLNCSYCYTGYTREYKSNILSISDVNDIFIAINDLAKITNTPIKNLNLSLLGGEPLLPENFEILKLILKKCEKYEIKNVEIISNIVNLELFIELLNKFKGNISIKVTLNGDRILHDNVRKNIDGKGTYIQTLKNLNLILNNIQNASIDLSILIDKRFDHKTARVLFNDLSKYNILNNKKVNIKFGKIQFRYTYEGEENYLDNVIPAEEYTNKILDLYMNNKFIDSEMIGGGPLYKLFDLFDNWTKNKLIYPSFKGCDAIYPGRYNFYTDGYIYPCTDIVGIKQFRVGTYKNGLKLNNEFFYWRNFKVSNLKKCNKCKYVAFCNGGCLITSKCKNGSFEDVYCENISKGIENLVIYLDKEGLLI